MSGATQVDIAVEPTGPDAPVTTVERPANVPEKFWNAETGSVNTEALLASYGELEGKLGGTTQETPAEAPAGTETETPKENSTGDEQVDEIVDKVGLDVGAIEAHWLEHKTLPDDQVAKLEAAGISKEIAEEFIGYRVAQADKVRAELLSPFGGEDAVNSMVDWAGKNWTPEQAKAFNDAMNGNDLAAKQLSLKALNTDYTKAKGVQPRLVTPTNATPAGNDTFANMAQLMAAQNDPRYKTDSAYRDAVIAKLGRSNF
ncbi:scaffolding protein [Rhizobium phage Pasto]|uniref:Scaffolding protein n=1 Tax=Rhizobium phage Pasto TaxID=2767575 RepID=A0A7S6R6Z7_9CAUD|nr:scaffolding protein [Rhizobium phage Pasto]